MYLDLYGHYTLSFLHPSVLPDLVQEYADFRLEWWLASKEKLDKAAKVLLKYNGHIEDYNVHEVIVRIKSPPHHFCLF